LLRTSSLIRKIPDRIRTPVGVWLINMVSRHWVFLWTYLTLIRGKPPKNMGLQNGYCYYDYHGRRILAPWNAAQVFIEIFEDEVYEKLWQPAIGDVILDVGAYVGMFTTKMSLGGCKVYAIEPSPGSFRIMYDNCLGLKDCTLIRKAIMSQSGIERLYQTKSAGADNLIKPQEVWVDVEATTLDNLVESLHLDRLDYVKLDVEGAELEALAGAGDILKRGVKWIIAVYHSNTDDKANLRKVIQVFTKHSYRIVMFKGLRSYLYAEPG
jgi:FkbM family methyltransferase